MKKVMPWQHCLGTVFAFRAFSTEFGPTNYLNVLVWIFYSLILQIEGLPLKEYVQSNQSSFINPFVVYVLMANSVVNILSIGVNSKK